MNAKLLATTFAVIIQIGQLLAQPSNSTIENVDPYKVFYEAVTSGDLPKARETMIIARDMHKPIPDSAVVGLVLSSKFFDRVNPLLEELVKTNGVSILEDDNTFAHMRPEHIVWMDKAGFLSDKFAPRFLILAAQRGDSQMVKTLLKTHVASEFSDQSKGDALYAATCARSLECVDYLLERGARPESGMWLDIGTDSRWVTSIDAAAQRYWIRGLKHLDKTGKYKKFISNFEKEFPETGTSRFTGVWSNHQDGFYASVIVFDPDATGTLNDTFMPIVWKSTDSGVDVFPVNAVDEKGIERERVIHLVYNPQKDELVWKINSSREDHYRKGATIP